ncbi:alpha/beta hydrolase family protein [Tenacibaculum sp.]|uniref:alpha/beta hydrolase family protein n=1 Tax=Tenacibaculum sp. TaxID=1906242 RepID=UPI003D0A7A17
MRKIKLFAKIIGILIIIGSLYVGFLISKKYYNSYTAMESLNSTVLGIEIKPTDIQEAKRLKQGQILSKKLINLSEIKPLWNKVAKNDTLIDNFKHLNDINFFSITYKSDSLLVNGIIAEPKKEGKFPVIIFNRGGNKEIGKVAKAKTLYSLVYGTSKLVKEGYILIASCYRENDEFGGEDINDVLNLTETTKDVEKADPNRIGMFGWSRGGMMTYLALKKSNLITTAVVGNGPSDLSELIIDRPEMETEVCAELIPNYKENKTEELKKRSVIYWADKLDKNASLLILCGTEDERVKPNHADRIAQKLTSINYDFTLKKFKTDHAFSNKKDELNALLITWFKEKL